MAQTFANVKTLVIDGGAGNDQITVDTSITATTWLWAEVLTKFLLSRPVSNHTARDN